jgi:hypothetical protein
MPLESGTYIDSLVATNPTGTDPKSQGDDHLRLIKAAVKATFPNIAGAVTPTDTELNYVTGATSALQTQLNTHDSEITTLQGQFTTLDGEVVKLAGAQEITGAKNFSTAPLVASLELGHASDTTLSRIAAGRVAVEGSELARLDKANTFTGALQVFENSSASIMEIRRSDADTDAGRWRFQASTNGDWFLRAATDAGASSNYAIIARRSASAVTSIELRAEDVTQLKTQDYSAAPATTGAQVLHSDASLYDVGMNVMPPRTVAAAITFARTDVGKTLVKDESTARTWTTPGSTDTDIPLGSAINLMNLGSGDITIAAGSGVTLSFINGLGAAGTGSRTLAQGGIATLYKRTASSWVIWGNAGLS